jgi:hypothetical protein
MLSNNYLIILIRFRSFDISFQYPSRDCPLFTIPTDRKEAMKKWLQNPDNAESIIDRLQQLSERVDQGFD